MTQNSELLYRQETLPRAFEPVHLCLLQTPGVIWIHEHGFARLVRELRRADETSKYLHYECYKVYPSCWACRACYKTTSPRVQ